MGQLQSGGFANCGLKGRVPDSLLFVRKELADHCRTRYLHMSTAAFVLQWARLSYSQKSVVHEGFFIFTLLPLPKFAIPAPERVFLAAILISGSPGSSSRFLFLNFCIHLLTASCQFSLQNVSDTFLPLILTAAV